MKSDKPIHMLISYTSQNKVCCSYSQSLSSWGGSWPSSSFVFALSRIQSLTCSLSRTRGIRLWTGAMDALAWGGQYNEVFPVLISAIKSSQEQNPAPFLSECKFLFILIPLIKPRNRDHCPARAHTCPGTSAFQTPTLTWH